MDVFRLSDASVVRFRAGMTTTVVCSTIHNYGRCEDFHRLVHSTVYSRRSARSEVHCEFHSWGGCHAGGVFLECPTRWLSEGGRLILGWLLWC